jgi:protocatechuate 3,4-dioxygenase beta subunit
MRPIHLVLAVLVLAAAVAGLWFSIGSGRADIYAGGSASAAEQHGSSRLEGAASATASEGDAPDAEGAQRTALVAAPSEAEKNAAASKSDKPALVGRVVSGEAGSETGVAGATVFASTGSDWIQLPLDLEPEGLPKNWVKVSKTTTDAEGKYRFEELKPGSLRLAARAPGFAPRYLDRLDLPDKKEFTAPDLRLERGVVLLGKVIDREGHGIAGTTLLAALDTSGEGKMISVPGRGIPVATTAEDGTFRVDELAAGPWHLILDSPAHVVSEEEGRTERPGEERRGLVFVLEYGIEIHGTVKTSEGALPQGLRVTARPSQEREGSGPPSDSSAPAGAVASRARHATCSDDGTFALRGLQPAVRYRLTAWQKSDDPSGWKRVNGVDPVLANSGARGVELTYKPESALIFRVLDDKTGTPLTEFSVFAGIGRERILRDEKNEVVRKFPDGRVRFPELHPQTGKPVILRISAVAHADYEKKDILLKAGSDLDLGDLRLAPQCVVNVKLVDDESGAAVANGRVILAAKTDEEIGKYLQSPPDQDYWQESKVMFARSGPDGKARVTSLPGKMATLRASAKSYLVSDPVHVLPGDSDQSLEIRLKHGATVLVHVTDGSAHPVAGVGIAHRRPDAKQVEEGWYNDSAEQKTDNEGIAKFEALARGTHAFRVQDQVTDSWSEANAPRQPGWQDAIVGDGGSTTLEFNVPARGGFFGRVRENGAPLAGARLKLVQIRNEDEAEVDYWGGPNDPLAATTDHEGQYKFEHIRCGNYTLYLSHAARRMSIKQSVSVTSDAREHDFDLDVASVEGRVTDVDGRPLSGIEVAPVAKQGTNGDDQPYQMVVTEDDRGGARVNYEQSSRRSEKTDESGRYFLRGLATEQPFTIQVRGELVENAVSPEITLAPDEVRRGVDFALRRAGSIEVRLLGNVSDQNWFMARALRVADGKETLTQTIYLGSWNRNQTIHSLAAGHYKVALAPGGASQGKPTQEVETDVAAGETSHVSFELK